MRRIVRLNENDLARIVRRVIIEEMGLPTTCDCNTVVAITKAAVDAKKLLRNARKAKLIELTSLIIKIEKTCVDECVDEITDAKKAISDISNVPR